MILPIYTEPHEVLHKPAQPISEVTPAIRQLAADMRETMHNAKGVGLAAPQVGQSLALCIVELEDEEEPIPFLALVNPRITWGSPRQASMIEACLSIPGIEGPVRRPSRVRIKAQDLDGQRVEIEAGGLLSRILQHEIDHLNGILFTSYVAPSRLSQRPLVDYPLI